MSMVARAGEAFRAAWPLVGAGLAVAVNGVWIGALGYGISKFDLLVSKRTNFLPCYGKRTN
jgi:hypothetical protein